MRGLLIQYPPVTLGLLQCASNWMLPARFTALNIACLHVHARLFEVGEVGKFQIIILMVYNVKCQLHNGGTSYHYVLSKSTLL